MINNYDVAVLSEKVAHLESAVKDSNEASEISYDNTDSGLTADDVQGAIDEIVEMTDYKTANLVQGTDYSTYVDSAYQAIAEEKNGVVCISLVFSLKTVASSENAWKELYTLPENISKPKSAQNIGVIMTNEKYDEIYVSTDGSININSLYATTSGAILTCKLTYLS